MLDKEPISLINKEPLQSRGEGGRGDEELTEKTQIVLKHIKILSTSLIRQLQNQNY